jgi:hypothetical protein
MSGEMSSLLLVWGRAGAPMRFYLVFGNCRFKVIIVSLVVSSELSKIFHIISCLKLKFITCEGN